MLLPTIARLSFSSLNDMELCPIRTLMSGLFHWRFRVTSVNCGIAVVRWSDPWVTILVNAHMSAERYRCLGTHVGRLKCCCAGDVDCSYTNDR